MNLIEAWKQTRVGDCLCYNDGKDITPLIKIKIREKEPCGLSEIIFNRIPPIYLTSNDWYIKSAITTYYDKISNQVVEIDLDKVLTFSHPPYFKERFYGELTGKGIWLSPEVNWYLVNDNTPEQALVLIATEK